MRRTLDCDFSTTNFRFKDVAFDVVGYSTNSNTFHIVECKRTSKVAIIGHAFGQLLAYKSVLHQAGYEFLDIFLKQAHANIHVEDIADPVQEGRLRAKFYVGLTDDACDNVDLPS